MRGGEGVEGGDTEWAERGKEVEKRGWGESSALVEGARLNSGKT